MPATDEKIRAVVERYVALVATGTADDIVALYAEGATVEDPVGSAPLTSRDELHAFYKNLEPLEQEARVVHARICGARRRSCSSCAPRSVTRPTSSRRST